MAEADLGKRLAVRLREMRAERGLSQLDVVRNSTFGLSHYQKLERGVLDPRLSTLAKIADFFGTTLSDLLKGV